MLRHSSSEMGLPLTKRRECPQTDRSKDLHIITTGSPTDPRELFSAIRDLFLGAFTRIEPLMLVGELHMEFNDSLVSQPNTKALTSTLSRGLEPTGFLGSKNAECGTLPSFPLLKHSSSSFLLFTIPN